MIDYLRKNTSFLNVDASNPVVREHPLNRGMVGWWLTLPFNRSDNTYYDLGGKWHGTMSIPIPLVGTDRQGGYGARQFVWANPAQQRINLPDISGQFPNSEGTIAVWVKRFEATPSNNNKAGWGWLGTPPNSGFETLYTYGDGNTYVGWLDSARPITTTIANRTLWNHCVLVSKAGTNNYKLYVNGVQKAQATRNTFGMNSTPSFGGSRAANIIALDGFAEDWRIWNWGFAASDVKALYFESLAGYPNALRRTPLYLGRSSAVSFSLSSADSWAWVDNRFTLNASTQGRDAAAILDSTGAVAASTQSRDPFGFGDAQGLVGSPAGGDSIGASEGFGTLGVSASGGDPFAGADAIGGLSASLQSGDAMTLVDLASVLASTVSTDAMSVVDSASVAAALVSRDSATFADIGGYGVLISTQDSWTFSDSATWTVGVSSVDVVSMDSFAFTDGLRSRQVSATTLYDDFTGTTGADIGYAGEWNIHPSVASGNSDIMIDSTGGRARANRSAISIYYSTGVPASADQAVEWDFISVAEVTVGTMIHGFGLRCATGADTAYYGLLYRNLLSGVTEWRIIKRVTGTETILSQTTATFAVATTYHMAFSVTGTSLSLSVNGVVQCTATDSAISATGRYAIYMDPIDTVSTRDGRLDNLAISGSPQNQDSVTPESITLLTGETFGFVEGPLRLTSTLSTAEPFALADSAGLSATIAQRESWAFLENGVFTFFGPVAIYSGDGFGFADRTGAQAATVGHGDAAGFADGFGLSASLAASDLAAFADLWTAPFYFVTSRDSFGVVERSGGLSASVLDSDGFDLAEAAGIRVALGAGDTFGGGERGAFEVFTPPIGISGSDLARFVEGAAITVNLVGRDPILFVERQSIAAAVASGDAVAFVETALASLAPLGIVSMDSAGFVDRLVLEGSPTDAESWDWLESSAIGIGVVSLDAFRYAEIGSYSRELVVFDAFAFVDGDADTEAFVGSLVYRIYANDGLGGPIDYDSVVASTTDLTWTSWPIAASSDYWFAVRVYALATTLEEKNLDAAVRIITDSLQVDVTNRPAPPTGLRAIPLAGGNVRVEWTYRQAATTRRPTGFRVYRGVGAVSWVTPVATVAATGGIAGAYSTTLGPLTDGVAYRFGVRAFNASAEEPNTIEAAATADATGPAPPTGLIATLTTES